MKPIRVSDDIKNKLDELKEDNETYNNVVTRLIRENQDLKQDKKFLANAVRVLLLGKLLKGDFDDIQSEDDLKLLFDNLINEWTI